MSRKHLVTSIVVIALVFLLASALTFGPEAWANTRGGERDIQPGGWPGKIRSYYNPGAGPATILMIPSVEGPNGFIITGLHFAPGIPSLAEIRLNEGSGIQTIASFTPNVLGGQIHIEPGIPVPTGSEVHLYIDGFTRSTLTGYSY